MPATGRYAYWFVPLAMLSGCAGSVIFGHTIGERPPPAAPLAQPASQTQPPAAQPATVAVPTPARPVGSVEIALTPGVQRSVDAEARFTREALLAAIERELRARGLLDPGAAGGGRTLAVSIEDFATRAATNAVILGYRLGAGTLSASLSVRSADQRDVRTFRVQADSRLASRTDDGNKDPLGPLFYRFAELTADALAGADAMPR